MGTYLGTLQLRYSLWYNFIHYTLHQAQHKVTNYYFSIILLSQLACRAAQFEKNYFETRQKVLKVLICQAKGKKVD